MNFLKSRKSIIIIVTIIMMVVIALTTTPSDNPNFLERAAEFIFSPVRIAVNWPVDRVKGSINFFAQMGDYRDNNEKLDKENEELKEKVRVLESYEKENEELRNMLNLTKKYDANNSVVAEITAKDPGMWFDVFMVNRGKKDGIEKGMVVLTHKGLVGKITEVFEDTSKVVSILDISNSVSARLTKTGDLVTTKGDMNLKEKGLLKINYITSDIPISQGDVIETSGIGGIYPAGIFIGNVKELEKAEANDVNRYAIIDTGVNFRALKEVLILKNK